MTRTRQHATAAAGLRRARGRASVLLLGGVAMALAAGLGVPSASAEALAGVPGSALTVTGTVERLELDDFDAPEAGHHDAVTVVNSDRGPVQVPASALEHVPDGATVRVGLRSSSDHRVDRAGVHPLAARSTPVSDDTEAGPEVAAVEVVAEPTGALTDTGAGATTTTVAAAATTVHSVLVVVATPAGGSASTVSASDVAATVNGSVDAYWREVTAGGVGFSAAAYPSVVTTTSTPCLSGSVASSFTFWDEVKSKVGFVEGPGKHLLVYFRTLPACGGIAGLGTIGSDLTSGGLVWSNGYNTTGVLGHELGHNLGLGHSQTVSCTVNGVRVTDAPPSSCTERSYADTNDIMAVSWQNQGFLNASHLRSLGLLGGAEAAPTGNGSIALSPLASGTGTRALTLTAGTERYVVEYRAPVGQDAWMGGLTGWGSVGVTVRREYDTSQPGASGYSARESFLLDGDPGTDDASFGALYPTLPVGSWVDLAGGNLGLRVLSQDGASAVVEYRNGPPSTDTRYVAPPRTIVTAPVVSLMKGSVKRTSSGPIVPARWSWTVMTTATETAAATARGVSTVVRARASSGGNPWAYRATATAADGSVVSATGTAKGHYRAEAPSSYVRYSKGWSKMSASSAVGSAVRATTTKNAKVTVKVTGRGFALLLQRGSKNGSAAVYVDGKKVATLKLRASSTSTRVVYTMAFPAYGKHTVVVKNLSSGSRGRLAFDGIVRI